MIELGGSGLPPAQALAAAGVAATLAVAGSLSLALLPPAELQERAFLEAADSVRTRIAEYWLEQQRAGHPRLPTSLQQLGRDAVPPDPWTGVADWGTVRDTEGGIVGVYSRSGHRIDHPDLLASLAEPRPLLSAASRAVLGVSAWQFRWVPPAIGADPILSQTAFPKATDALLGRWPGQDTRAGRLVLDAPAPIRGLGLRRASRPGAALAARGTAGQVDAPVAVAGVPESAWNIYVPMQAESENLAARNSEDGDEGFRSVPVALVGSTALAQAENGAARPVNDDPVAATADPEFQFSNDPRTRRCQLSLSANNPRQVCRSVTEADDNGLALDSCVRDLEARVAQCAQGR